MAKLEKTVMKIEFVKSRDFRTVAATGAWGGPNPQGEIVCSFYVERQQFPDDLVIEIDPITKEAITKTETEKRKIFRELQVSVVMRPDIAKGIGQWLVEKSDTLLDLTKESDN